MVWVKITTWLRMGNDCSPGYKKPQLTFCRKEEVNRESPVSKSRWTPVIFPNTGRGLCNSNVSIYRYWTFAETAKQWMLSHFVTVS